MIKQRAFDDYLLLIEARDYRYNLRYIVVYGLQIFRHNTLAQAENRFLECFNHARANDKELEL